MKNILALLVGLGILFGCSSTEQRTEAPYQYPGLTQAPPEASEYQNNQVMLENKEMAPAALLWDAIPSLFRKGGKAHTIVGGCQIQSAPDSNIVSPCQNVRIVLLNEDGHEVANSITEGGRFSFNAISGEKYRIDIRSSRLKLSSLPSSLVNEGDRIEIRLVSKKK